MKLPNGELAVVDIEKLAGYCLNPEHPRGRHKARVFAAVLGVRQEDVDFLRTALLDAARYAVCSSGEWDFYGQRFVLDFDLEGSRRPWADPQHVDHPVR